MKSINTKTTISWNIIRSCNYKCSYCTQYDDKLKGKKVKDPAKFVEFFQKLEGPLEIKFSGGEPFIYHDFLPLVKHLTSLGITISVVTNFSSDKAELEKFLEAAGQRLNVFSASLHLEYISEFDFLEKVFWFISALKRNPAHSQCSFVVTSVASPRELQKLQSIKELFSKNGIRLKVQPLKYNGSTITYTKEEMKILDSFGGHNNTGRVRNNFFGKKCLAGRNYFVVGPTGDVWRCYQAKKERKEFFGNIFKDEILPFGGAFVCPYDYCPCTVPIERKMIQK